MTSKVAHRCLSLKLESKSGFLTVVLVGYAKSIIHNWDFYDLVLYTLLFSFLFVYILMKYF